MMRALAQSRGEEIVRLTAESDERLKDAVAREMEIERLRAALRTISELHPDKDSDEGYNEWGEAECFGKAKELSNAAMKETP